jgi:hypothetical protein
MHGAESAEPRTAVIRARAAADFDMPFLSMSPAYDAPTI